MNEGGLWNPFCQPLSHLEFCAEGAKTRKRLRINNVRVFAIFWLQGKEFSSGEWKVKY